MIALLYRPLALQSSSKQSTKPQKRTGNEPTRRSKATGGLSGRYNEEGVENYYARVAETYRNPHEPEVHAALQVAFKDRDYEGRILGDAGKEKKDSRILDLACGSGEVTLCLRDKLGKFLASDMRFRRALCTSMPSKCMQGGIMPSKHAGG